MYFYFLIKDFEYFYCLSMLRLMGLMILASYWVKGCVTPHSFLFTYFYYTFDTYNITV